MDDRPIEIHVAPDLDEHTRVSLRVVFGSPVGWIVSAVVLMISIALLFFATVIIMGSPPDYVFGPIFIVLALLLPIASYLRLRVLIRSRLKASIEASGESDAVFAEDAIVFRDIHRSVRLDWIHIKWARRVPEGVWISFASKQFFYSSTCFADGDFNRFMDLLRHKLGPQAKV